MKITLIKAFRSNDGCIWESEKDAIQQNIDECFGKTNISTTDTYTAIKDKVLLWIHNNPKDVRYILNNIDKIDI
jgi:hypothetical protein